MNIHETSGNYLSVETVERKYVVAPNRSNENSVGTLRRKRLVKMLDLSFQSLIMLPDNKNTRLDLLLESVHVI